MVAASAEAEEVGTTTTMPENKNASYLMVFYETRCDYPGDNYGNAMEVLSLDGENPVPSCVQGLLHGAPSATQGLNSIEFQ